MMANKKKVTIKDISEEVGVSCALINRALNNKEGVSKETRQRILETADRLGYRVNRVAQSMARKCINIGVLIPDSWLDYYSIIKEGIDEEFEILRDYNVECQYYTVNNIHSSRGTIRALKKCIEDEVQGVIICDAFPFGLDKIFEELKEHNIAVVLNCGLHLLDDKVLCSVQIDAYRSGKMAAEMLGFLTKENSDVVIFVGNKDNDEHQLKIKGFIDEAKLKNLNIIGIYETHDDADIAYRLAGKVIGECDGVDGIYSATANTASICDAVTEKNCKAKIVGTDLCEQTVDYIKRGVLQCSIYQDLRMQGRKAMRILYEYLAEHESADKIVRIAPHLVISSNVDSYYKVKRKEDNNGLYGIFNPKCYTVLAEKRS